MKKSKSLILIVLVILLFNIAIINDAFANNDELINTNNIFANSNLVEVYVEDTNLMKVGASHESTVTDEMSTSSFWINKIGNDANKLLLNKDQISVINQEIIDGSGTQVFDITAITEKKTQENRKQILINSVYETFEAHINKNRKLYIAGELIDNNAYVSKVQTAIRYTGFENDDEIKQFYGVAVRRTEMKNHPVAGMWGYDSPDDPDDEAVISALDVNEPFTYMAKCTIDGETFYWGYTYNCSGWVNANDIATFDTKEAWIEGWKVNTNENNFIVVTQDSIRLQSTSNSSQVELKIGTILKLVPSESIPALVNNQATYNNHVVYLPIRQDDGKVSYGYALIAQNNKVTAGFLPLTQANILNVAFSCMGNRYGWGGMLNSMDCTLYTKSIYKCFGLNIPRNTTWQQKVPQRVDNIGSFSDEEKMNYLDNCPAGTILFFTGHAMMYVGQHDGEYYVISDTGSLSDSQGELDVRKMYSVVLNPLSARRGGTKGTWLHNLSAALVFGDYTDNPNYINNNIYKTVDDENKQSNIKYIDGVTTEMVDSSFWKNLAKNPTKQLLSSDKINELTNKMKSAAKINDNQFVAGNKDFIVVTQDRIILEPSIVNPEVSQVELPLGTSLKLVPEEEIPKVIGGRGPWNNYVVYLPVDIGGGITVNRIALIPEHYSVSVGYLDFNEENLLDVLFRCVGDSYGLLNHDEAFVTKLFNCFGLYIPNGIVLDDIISDYVTSVSSLNATEKELLIKNSPIGTIYITSNEILIKIGSYNDNNYIIGSINTIANSPINSTILAPLSTNNWINDVKDIISFGNNKNDNNFKDVLKNKWYFRYINYVNYLGIMTGYNNGSDNFGPDDNIKRGQFITMLWRLNGEPKVNIENPFDDVPNNKYCIEAVKWAYLNGITTGYTKGDSDKKSFGPDDFITREQIATFIYRYYTNVLGYLVDLNNVDFLKFDDKDNFSQYAYDGLRFCVKKDILTGKEVIDDNKEKHYLLESKSKATRAQGATMINRLIKLFD